MDSPSKSAPAGSATSSSLFQVYLRLKPPTNGIEQLNGVFAAQGPRERYLTVEPPSEGHHDELPTHITITPPMESRRRAVEKFAFTKVFQEDSEQLEIFKGTGVVPLIEGVMGADGMTGRDGLLATLGVTGSGKSHTILGTKSRRGMTQMSLDVLFQSLGERVLHPSTSSIFSSLSASDSSEAQVLPANAFLDGIYGEVQSERFASRAATPMTVCDGFILHPSSINLYPSVRGPSTGALACGTDSNTPRYASFNSNAIKRHLAKLKFGSKKDISTFPNTPNRRLPPRPSGLSKLPSVEDVRVQVDQNSDYAVLISMYEVYNDRIFDLLTSQASAHTQMRAGGNKDMRRRPLLFKPTEQSPDRKVVAGLRKIICGSLTEALMVLETGLMERRIAGTGSNSASSRSHGFFCVEVKKRNATLPNMWWGSTLTIVDLAGSERARNAKTAGATLAEAGKINESLMYLGQCLQMQSDNHDNHKSALVPFRQCKLTELLFSNSFPSASSSTHFHASTPRNPQRAIMIVTADPLGDFNATSQILRYSALAREVTVPRIPSVTSTILAGISSKRSSSGGRTTPSTVAVEELELAAQEIARLGEESEILQMRLAEEEKRRHEAESAWKATEERCLEVEQDVREECWAEMESKMEEERIRWKGVWGAETDRNDEHVDRKLEILTRSIQIYEDPQNAGNAHVEELENENDSLRRKLAILERELQGRSPTKKNKILTPIFNTSRQSSNASDVENRLSDFSDLTVHGTGETTPSKAQTKMQTPGKKTRKLTTRKWDLGPEEMTP
ncbi:MAG: hypothetical protein M4579_003252 [Chaenotheca gracillima]|nr:MAG: hypothetical protein M4579_003252 [Chaenotheca gracillima]